MLMRSLYTSLLIFFIWGSLGCGTKRGYDFNQKQASSIKIGMSRSQVESIMGHPQIGEKDESGNFRYIYDYFKSSSIYGHAKSLRIFFDDQERVEFASSIFKKLGDKPFNKNNVSLIRKNMTKSQIEDVLGAPHGIERDKSGKYIFTYTQFKHNMAEFLLTNNSGTKTEDLKIYFNSNGLFKDFIKTKSRF